MPGLGSQPSILFVLIYSTRCEILFPTSLRLYITNLPLSIDQSVLDHGLRELEIDSLCHASGSVHCGLQFHSVVESWVAIDSSNSHAAISSNSVRVAFLDSHYTELEELVEKVFLLQTLEKVVGSNNIMNFTPQNDILVRKVDPEFKCFLHKPGNVKALQKLLMFHVVPQRIVAEEWSNGTHEPLAKDWLKLSMKWSGAESSKAGGGI